MKLPPDGVGRNSASREFATVLMTFPTLHCSSIAPGAGRPPGLVLALGLWDSQNSFFLESFIDGARAAAGRIRTSSGALPRQAAALPRRARARRGKSGLG